MKWRGAKSLTQKSKGCPEQEEPDVVPETSHEEVPFGVKGGRGHDGDLQAPPWGRPMETPMEMEGPISLRALATSLALESKVETH